MPLVLEKTIPASPHQVFSVLSDLSHGREWMPAIQRIDNQSQGPFGVGKSWRETRQAGKRTFESTVRVTAFEPGTTLGLAVVGKAMDGTMRFTLKAVDAGTAAHYEAEMRGRGLMRLMSGTINRMMAKEDADLLDRLASQVKRRA